MLRLSDHSLRSKMIVGFGALALVGVALSALAAGGLHSLAVGEQRLYGQGLVPAVEGGKLMADFQAMRALTRDINWASANHDSTTIRAKKLACDSTFAEIDSLSTAYERSLATAEERSAFAEFRESRRAYGDEVAQISRMADAGRAAEGWALQARGHGSTSMKKLMAVQKLKAKQAALMLAENGARRARLLWSMVLLLLAGLAVGIPIVVNVMRRVSTVAGKLNFAFRSMREQDLASVTAASEALARGDLTVEPRLTAPTMGVAAHDEFAVMASICNDMLADIRRNAAAYLQARDSVAALLADTRQVVAAARRGELAHRAEPGRFEGSFREQVHALNEVLETITSAVAEVSTMLRRASERDLTARVTGEYGGELEELKRTANQTLEQLDRALSEVASTTEELASASRQIAGGSQALAQGAGEQASSLEEVSSSLQELASMSRQNSAAAREARALAEEARESAADGVLRMQELSGAMAQLRGSADATARIVKTIDEIAFQTNLLALNAAVEAARAGDAGRGFAVVAQEVRSLAQRSAEAARQTAALIEEGTRSTGGSVELNARVAAQLGEIAARVDRMSEVMQGIAAGSDQQDQGVTEISSAVERMNGVTQEVAARSEESASAAEELSGQAVRLRSLTGSFTLAAAHGARVQVSESAVQEPARRGRGATRAGRGARAAFAREEAGAAL